MAPRPIWRGNLRLALVSCPVALHSVLRGDAGLHFHLINPKTGHRVRMVTLDAETDQEVPRRDLVKGYEFQKDHFVLLEDQDFEEARIDSSTTLRINKFVAADSIDPIFFDTSYYIAPDDESGNDVFVVLRDAFRQSKAAALSRMVIARRERAVAVMPMGDGLVCHTLHEPKDLHDTQPLWEGVADLDSDPQMVQLARQLIDRQQGRFRPEDTTDRYEAKLREIIDARLKGEGITPEEPEPEPPKVVDLMTALKASLANDDEPPSRRRTAKSPPAKGSGSKASAAKQPTGSKRSAAAPKRSSSAGKTRRRASA